MSRRESQAYLLDLTLFEPFEFGPALLASLAFPGSREDEARKLAFEALCADKLHSFSESEPKKADERRTRYPHYSAINAKERRRRLRTLARRLQDRMTAACIALGYFDEALRHMFATIGEMYPDLRPEIGPVEIRQTPLPDGVRRHSLNSLFAYRYPLADESGCHNRQNRIWRESLPVIHLAVAGQTLSMWFPPGAVEYNTLLRHVELVRRVVHLAKTHEIAGEVEWGRRCAGVSGSSSFSIDPSILVRCRTEKMALSNF
jgi:hypothetical protein